MENADIKMERYSNVWDALEDTPLEAERMRVKCNLMVQIREIVKENGWSQTEAAKRCGVTQPRMSDLYCGRLHRFSIDAMCDMVTSLGRKVKIAVEG